jgi:hypothetical protein
VALSFLYLLIRRVLETLRFCRMDAAAKDAEILVLRHQLAVRPDGEARETSQRSLNAFTARTRSSLFRASAHLSCKTGLFHY